MKLRPELSSAADRLEHFLLSSDASHEEYDKYFHDENGYTADISLMIKTVREVVSGLEWYDEFDRGFTGKSWRRRGGPVLEEHSPNSDGRGK